MDDPHRFARLLAGYRHRQELSQQDAATIGRINASELSKAERGVKKRLQADVILRLIEGFKLSRKEAHEFLEAAGYPASLLDRVKFNPRNYPIATGIIAERLQGSHGFWPVWKLSVDGTVIAANLLAFRLWRALEETDTSIDPSRLLGENIFKVFVRPENLNRIAMSEKESDFWYTTLAIWKKLKDTVHSPIVTDFENAIETHPILKLLLRYGTLDIEREWEYHLRIYPSVALTSLDDLKAYLEFDIHVERIMTEEQEHTGYLVTAQPIGTFTIDRTQREYVRLIDEFKPESFVQREVDTYALEEEEMYPPFFPALHLDALGNIIFENTELITLFDNEGRFYRKHFFELLLSPHMIELMGGFDFHTMAIPVRRFLQRVKKFEQEHHPLFQEYQAIKAHLLRQDGFIAVLSELLQLGFSTGSVDELTSYHIETACPLTDTCRLSFDIIERLPLKAVEDYRVTFVPVDTVTKTALILLRLQREQDYQEVSALPEEQQLLYILAVLKTIIEGLTKKKGKADWGWHPEAFVKKISSELTAETMYNGNSPRENITRQLTWTLTQVLLDDEKRQTSILDMLRTFTEPAPYAHTLLLTLITDTKELLCLS